MLGWSPLAVEGQGVLGKAIPGAAPVLYELYQSLTFRTIKEKSKLFLKKLELKGNTNLEQGHWHKRDLFLRLPLVENLKNFPTNVSAWF